MAKVILGKIWERHSTTHIYIYFFNLKVNLCKSLACVGSAFSYLPVIPGLLRVAGEACLWRLVTGP